MEELLVVSKVLTPDYVSERLTDWFGEPTEFTKCEFVKGSSSGDSYLSDVYRATVFGKCVKSGRSVDLKLLIKCPPANIGRRKTFRSEEFFRNEINFYLHVLPALMKLQAKKKVTKPFDYCPKVFAAVTDGVNDFLALEDLSVFGFTTAVRQEGIDYNHFVAILECFAKYHALSFALKDQEPDTFNSVKDKIFETYYFEKNWDWYKTFWKSLCACATDAVEKEYPNTVYSEKIREFASEKTFFDCCKAAADYGKTSVFGHGDSWICNFLVRYKPDTSVPEDVKMIDFQLTRCASPILDISFCIYACSTEELRKQYYDKFLQFYYDELSKQIRELGSDPDKLYPHSLFMEEVKKYSFFGLAFCFESTPVVIMDPEDAFEMDSIQGEDAVEIADIWVIKPIKKQAGRLRLANNFVHAVNKGFV